MRPRPRARRAATCCATSCAGLQTSGGGPRFRCRTNTSSATRENTTFAEDAGRVERYSAMKCRIFILTRNRADTRTVFLAIRLRRRESHLAWPEELRVRAARERSDGLSPEINKERKRGLESGTAPLGKTRGLAASLRACVCAPREHDSHPFTNRVLTHTPSQSVF